MYCFSWFVSGIVILCLALTQALIASEAELNLKVFSTESLISEARNKQLAHKPQWLSLLHYNQGGTIHNRNQSYVQSEKFFLSMHGKNDPIAELESNILYFFSNDPEEQLKRCQFPARFQWISEQLNLENFQSGLSQCETYLAMHKQVAAKKITLVFPSAYMNSASSIFGHTLFRIDNAIEDETVILNWAVNYGAKLNPADNAFEYAYKGISGIYSGQYFVVPYAQKIKEYSQMENRDIWEFTLNLTQKEIDFLIAHLWELQDIEFDYYFFDENCSYRLLELLDVIKPDLKLTHEFRFVEIPMDTVKTLHKNKLIKDEVFRASKERILKNKIKQLNRQEIKLSKALSDIKQEIKNTTNDASFKNLEIDRKLLVAQTAYELLRFKQAQTERQQAMALRSLKLLKLINEITQTNTQTLATSEEKLTPTNETLILSSHDSRRLGISLGHQEHFSSFSKLSLRMAYHDLIDNADGYLNGAHIVGPEIEIRNQETKTQVNHYSLFDVISLNPVNQIRKDFSWRISLQGNRIENGNQHLSSDFKTGGGFTFQYGVLTHYQLLSPTLSHNADYKHNFKSGIHYEIGLLSSLGKHKNWLKIEAKKLEGLDTKITHSIAQQIELHRNHGLRVEATYLKYLSNPVLDSNKEISLSYLFYF